MSAAVPALAIARLDRQGRRDLRHQVVNTFLAHCCGKGSSRVLEDGVVELLLRCKKGAASDCGLGRL